MMEFDAKYLFIYLSHDIYIRFKEEFITVFNKPKMRKCLGFLSIFHYIFRAIGTTYTYWEAYYSSV